MRHLFLAMLLIAAVGATDDRFEPSSRFNLPVQKRTRTCVAMKGDKIPLRFADGTPTGYFARGDDPSQQGDEKRACPPGSLEIDAHETIKTGDGTVLYFHPGGGPSHYRDYVNNGQYGHVAAADLKEQPKTSLTGNGKPAPLSGILYFITPTRIPDDMFYKPNADDAGRTGSTYLTYGDPGFDKTRGKAHWTYINWSWVQNGGSEYPANKCNGGGMVRALGKPGTLLWGCKVEPIIGYSYGRDNKINGRVTAFYGRMFAGPEDKGDEIFGWLPLCYQKTDDVIVPCISRAQMRMKDWFEPPVPKSNDRMERMAWNLFSPRHKDANTPAPLTRWRQQFRDEKDLLARMELLTEMSRLDDAQMIDFLGEVTKGEKDQRVIRQGQLLIDFMAAGGRKH